MPAPEIKTLIPFVPPTGAPQESTRFSTGFFRLTCNYDPQKATRITLISRSADSYDGTYLARTSRPSDMIFGTLDRFRMALGNSIYLDGAGTAWDQQFWSLLFFSDGSQFPE